MIQNKIRNFCIIAHIDHGKSTLADRFLELTKTVSKREMREQFLDQMELERERGITIKLQPVRMEYQGYILNLIDTPGHVDFTYEVSRSLAAVEGAILLVDATRGIQAQTLANVYLALQENLVLIPVVNKIDLPNAEPKKTASAISKTLGISEKEILFASGKTGQGVKEIIAQVVKRIPPPKGREKPLRALIFDSHFDPYQGVIAYVRLVDGKINKGDKIFFLGTKKESEVKELGYFKPEFLPASSLNLGEVGYIVTGLKEVGDCRVGDTIVLEEDSEKIIPLPGYRQPKPVVYAGFYPKQGKEINLLRDALSKLKLNDAALEFTAVHSVALGNGFQGGFLGLLHLEITKERLKREFGLDLVITTPSVSYKIIDNKSREKIIHSAAELPDASLYREIQELWAKVEIISPKEYLGEIMEMVQNKRGAMKNMSYLDPERVLLTYEIPLANLVVDFHDLLKSLTKGFGSFSYEILDFRPEDLVRLDILVAGEKVDALSSVVHRSIAQTEGRKIVKKLKEVIPQQMFQVALQAAIGGNIIARETLRAWRKDVTAKLYGGDVTRKMKLLEKQKRGKKKMKEKGRVDIPPEAFLAVLKK